MLRKSNTSLVRLYAVFLRDYAHASKREGTLTQEIDLLDQVIRDNRSLWALFSSPFFPVSTRAKILQSLCDQFSFSKDFSFFLELMNQRHVLCDLPRILDVYREIAASYQKLCVRIDTADELDTATQKSIIDKLSAVQKKKLEVSFELQPSLLGGIVVWWKDLRLDGSRQTQLERMRTLLEQRVQ